MSAEPKPQFQTSNFEIDSPRMAGHSSKLNMLSLVDSARLGMSLLALCAGITILGVSADALAVYDQTYVPANYLLPLWPDRFDLRPTVALVVCSAIVIVANGLTLFGSRVSFIRQNTLLHGGISLLGPLVSFVAALIAMSFFYGANTSATTDTMQSWSCRWEDVYMTTRPNFGTLCKQSKAGLYLNVLLVPLEVMALGVSGWQAVLERNVEFVPATGSMTVSSERKGSGSVPSSRG